MENGRNPEEARASRIAHLRERIAFSLESWPLAPDTYLEPSPTSRRRSELTGRKAAHIAVNQTCGAAKRTANREEYQTMKSTTPPSTLSAAPVVADDCFDAAYTTILATSSTVAGR